ncbi:UNVERIFIED_CONTAM: hypothetical protein FKN15_066855 [Acipenser sinensis]
MCFRLFEYRGRVSPAPRVVPVKRPRVAVPLVRRVKSLPVKLITRSAAITNNSAKQKLKSNELQAIKSELTQIKSNIDALLGRLEQITEEKYSATEIRKTEESKSEVSQDDSASETEELAEEPLNGDECEEDMLFHSACVASTEIRKTEESKSEVSQDDSASETEELAEEPLNGDECEEDMNSADALLDSPARGSRDSSSLTIFKLRMWKMLYGR